MFRKSAIKNQKAKAANYVTSIAKSWEQQGFIQHPIIRKRDYPNSTTLIHQFFIEAGEYSSGIERSKVGPHLSRPLEVNLTGA